MGHLNSIKFIDKAEIKVQSYESALKEVYIHDLVDALLECTKQMKRFKRILAWTYVFGYYLEERLTPILNLNQGQLEQ